MDVFLKIQDKLDQILAILVDAPSTEDALFVDIKSASLLIHIPISTLRHYVKHGDLPHLFIGKHLRFERDVLIEWAKNHRQKPLKKQAVIAAMRQKNKNRIN